MWNAMTENALNEKYFFKETREGDSDRVTWVAEREISVCNGVEWCHVGLTVSTTFISSDWQFSDCVKMFTKPWKLSDRNTTIFKGEHNTSRDPEEGTRKTVHPHTGTYTQTSISIQNTQTCEPAPQGKCRYTNISALQPKTVSLCWVFWAPESGLGAETVPTRFFYAMQQVFWGEERCIQLIWWAWYNQVKEKSTWKDGCVCW